MLRDPVRRVPLLRLLGGVVLLVVAGLMAAAAAGVAVPWQWLAPTAALAGGVWLAWSQLERTDALARRGPVSWARLVGALALVVLAVVLLTTQGRDAASMLLALLAGVAVLAGVALVLAPWWLRLLNALGDQRAATARESERADIAAHLHDSVLQTLAVIRVQAEDPAAVRRLARAQERELRQWLYQDRPPAGSSLAAELKTTAAEVEDLTGVEIEMVLVGDRSPTAALEALVGATREALLNAGRHGRPPVSLYGELSERSVEVFVRDRGEGFDLDAVPTDRLGVRESILGRVRRQGGNASIRTSPGAGTEIRLQMDIGVMGSE
jgi:signal transduction histidine kinase